MITPVNLDKTRSEHNESAMPPKLAVKSDVGYRRRWAISGPMRVPIRRMKIHWLSLFLYCAAGL
jgi:hypothetical protein